MRSHTFSIEFPQAYESAQYVDVSTIGTGLDGLAAGSPLAVTVQEDIWPSSEQGDGIIVARASAADTVRFRGTAPPQAVPISVTVTELL